MVCDHSSVHGISAPIISLMPMK